MASKHKIIKQTAERLNLHFISKKYLAYGFCQNYLFLIRASGGREEKIFIFFCVKNQDVSLQTVLNVPTGCRLMAGAYKSAAEFNIKGNDRENTEKLVSFLNAIANALYANQFQNCDELGNECLPEIYLVKDEYHFLREAEAGQIRQKLAETKQADALIQEQYLPGIGGACLGALIASVIIYLVARLGFVTTISSALMALTVWGYKWKGVKFSKTSAVICTVISLIFSYVIFRLDIAISIHKAIDVSVSDAFRYAKEIMQLADGMSTYYENMILIVGLSATVTIVMSAIEISSHESQFRMEKLP